MAKKDLQRAWIEERMEALDSVEHGDAWCGFVLKTFEDTSKDPENWSLLMQEYNLRSYLINQYIDGMHTAATLSANGGFRHEER